MQYNTLIAYIVVMLFAMTMVFAQANKEREQFADLLQKRKHLNGYWVGKRYVVATTSDEEASTHSDEDLSEAKRASYLVGKRGTYLVGKRASYLVGRKRRNSMVNDNSQ
ncbi:unnamed protein product [Adineta steineri]|uniref:Uncharacterized protein n=1 Tax=Adineta steineri TaxID=433720 RepID=A0A814MLW0_9BILA|nr:unnamed protein product [Adineta steineri]CAF1080557.1 unnamed protein product [Adineta steineri]CAF1081161.1 unnamed protein product [Adineta steineri]CAF1127026.1 unnamed protein product [Adineta steineri]CAF1136654.1 unnamed protein product [Adineta steineri]